MTDTICAAKPHCYESKWLERFEPSELRASVTQFPMNAPNDFSIVSPTLSHHRPFNAFEAVSLVTKAVNGLRYESVGAEHKLNELLFESTGTDNSAILIDFLIHKVLRFLQAGHFNPSRRFRFSRDFPIGNSLAVKGDVLIHGPYLVAQSVGSEWRNHRLHQETIQTN